MAITNPPSAVNIAPPLLPSPVFGASTVFKKLLGIPVTLLNRLRSDADGSSLIGQFCIQWPF